MHHNYLCVGDIILLMQGMDIPVDGIVLDCNQLNLDESAMTGESDERRKEPYDECMQRREDKIPLVNKDSQTYSPVKEAHALPSPILLSGTNVAGGDGRFLCIVVGDSSALGMILKQTKRKPHTTPLQ
jgi:magnesium-transporting ATPase (P-type)